MTANGKLPAVDDKVPLLLSKRWIYGYVSIVGMFLCYALRVNLSVAIVCMVRDTNDTTTTTTAMANSSYLQDSSNAETSCAASDSSGGEDTGEFDWDKSTQSIILSSFFYGYIVTQLPGGWLSSRFGGKRVMGYCSLIVAIATLLTPVAARWDYRAVVTLRVVMGLAQAVTYPTMHAMLGRWAPKAERTRLSSFIYCGSHFGNIIAYIVSGLLCAYGFDNGWGSIFYVFGVLGVLWVGVWFYLVYDTPDSHPTISKAERDYIVNSIGEVESKEFKVPWRSIFTSRAVWVNLVAHMCNNWMHYTLLTGLPTFMKEVLKFDIKENGILSAVPYMCMAVTTISIGQLADFLRNRYLSTTHTRRMLQAMSFLFSGACIVAVGFVSCEQRVLAVAILAMAVGFEGFCYSGYMPNQVDFAPRYAGVLYGITNCLSTIPGIVAPIVIGQLTPNKSQAEWRNVFYVCGGFTLFGAIVFGCFAQGELEPWAVEQREDDVVTSPEKRGEKPAPETHSNPAFDDVDDVTSKGASMENNSVHMARL